MPRRNLTDLVVRSLSTSKAQEDVFDTSSAGFGVRVTRHGRKTFFLRYRSRGRQRRLNLGIYPDISLADARKQATVRRGQVAQELDPAGERHLQRQGPTFAELAAEYLERHAKLNKRTWQEDERKIRRDLGHWGPTKAAEIKQADVLLVLDAVIDRGSPGAANRLLALIRKMFNWGLERDLVEHNPCAGLKPLTPTRSRDRVLSEAEIRALWHALAQELSAVQAAIRLLLLTAQRSVEVRSMRWQDIDGDVWRIPAEVVKGKRAHAVPLSAQALRILDACRSTSEGEWVSPSPRRKGQPLNGSTLSHTPQRLFGCLGYRWWVHDLRRTAASHMAARGVNRFVIRQILNHADPTVTAVDDRHSYLPEMRAALDLWGSRVEEIVSAETG